jgi:tRNA 2-selenouridine synthase
VLTDAQRVIVGTLHAQEGAFAAKRVGAALVARNISTHLENSLHQHDRHWRPLVYCWRGGNRSGALATILARIGWRTTVLAGGYQAFRRHVYAALSTLPAMHRFIVLAGPTGSAKTRLLHALGRHGVAILDLEALAGHRGSVLGQEPGQTQPSQKHFETRLWHALRALPPTQPIFVEAESRKIGQCQLPDALIQAIRRAPVILIDAPRAIRCQFLLSEYGHLCQPHPTLMALLGRLVPQHGHAIIQSWQQLANAGAWPALVEQLLSTHYDPSYYRSIRRNFARFAHAPTLSLPTISDAALSQAAASLQAMALEFV